MFGGNGNTTGGRGGGRGRGGTGGFYGNSPPPSPPSSSGSGSGRFHPFAAFVMPQPVIPQPPRIGNVTINFRRGGGHSVLLDCNPCPDTVTSLHHQAMGLNRPQAEDEVLGQRAGSPAGSERSGYSSASSLSSFGGGFEGPGQHQPITSAAEMRRQQEIQQQEGGGITGNRGAIPLPEIGFRPPPSYSMGTQTDTGIGSRSSSTSPEE